MSEPGNSLKLTFLGDVDELNRIRAIPFTTMNANRLCGWICGPYFSKEAALWLRGNHIPFRAQEDIKPYTVVAFVTHNSLI